MLTILKRLLRADRLAKMPVVGCLYSVRKSSGQTSRVILFSLLAIALVVLDSPARASQCMLPDPQPNPSSPAATAISSLLASLRSQPTPNIGCFVRGPIELPETDGFFSDFDNGQIIWSSSQQMVLAAYWVGTPPNGEANGQITVQWQMLAPYQYDLFLVRWNDVALPANQSKQANTSSAGGSNINTFVIGTGGTKGTGGTASETDSRYSIIVEGCKKGATFKGDVCAQGWSAPAYVDVNPIDVLHDILGNPLPPAATPADTSSTFENRVSIGFARSCNLTLGGSIDQLSAWLALGYLYMAGIENAPSYCVSSTLIAQANSWLAAAKVTTDVGTTAGLRHGDYDMALVSFIPLIYNFSNKLTPTVRQNFLHGLNGQTPLLSQSGGANKVKYWEFVDLIATPETENHIMNTESARYLTNQLLWEEAINKYPPGSLELETARQAYDNTVNDLQSWMLYHLQRFAKNDFHEYNARPYMNLSIAGIHNLAEYATDVPVKTAATIILNYLAAKLAVSSSGFRRAAPFRRHYEASDFNLLIEEGTGNSNNHDQAIWLEPTIFGTTQLIQALRHGHLEWKAEGDMSATSFGKYRVPDLILDLVMRDEASRSTGFAPLPGLTYFQVFRHEGVELYARDPNFLISAGGDWEPNTPVDQILIFGSESANGAALPTTLMPAWDGDFIAKLVQIGGNSDEKKRSNACVAPGFACGLNPIIPISFMQKVITGPRPCALPVTGVISEKWNQLGGQDGMLGCPLSAQTNLAGASLLQQFERGQIVFSQPQGMVVAGYYQKGSEFGFGVDWNITSSFKYDFFLVRWNKNGTNVGQHKYAASKAGMWTAPSSGFGNYTMIVEGCHNRTAAPASCGQSWTLPVEVDFPAQNSCFRTDPTQNWVFLDVTSECGAPAGRGFSVAVFRAPCSNSTCSYGFFEAVDESKATFNNFTATTLANNGQTQFSATGINSYTTFGGNVIEFTPEHSADKWGIVSMTNQSISSDMSQWHLAKGDIIDADGKGCIIIKNPILGQALVMDLRTNSNNVINPTIVQASLFPGISCDTVKP